MSENVCPCCGQSLPNWIENIASFGIIAAYFIVGYFFIGYINSELDDFTKENRFWCTIAWPIFAILWFIGVAITLLDKE